MTYLIIIIGQQTILISDAKQSQHTVLTKIVIKYSSGDCHDEAYGGVILELFNITNSGELINFADSSENDMRPRVCVNVCVCVGGVLLSGLINVRNTVTIDILVSMLTSLCVEYVGLQINSLCMKTHEES